MKLLKFTLIFLIGLFFFSTSIQAQVKAFGKTGFSGQGVELKPGKYAYGQLENRGLVSLEGLRIPIGCDVKVYAYSLKVNCGSVGAQPGFAIGASHEVGRKGDLIFVDVNVTDFEKIVSMQYSMNWDSKVLQFEKVQNFKMSGLSGENFGLKEARNEKSKIRFSSKPIVIEVMKADGTPVYFNKSNGSITLK